MNINAEPIKIAEGFEFCEGPAFAPDGWLWLVNVEGGYVSKVSMTGQNVRLANTGGGPNGGQFDWNGNFIVCECKRRAIVTVSPEGRVSTLVESCEGRTFNGPNDIAVDADGAFYFTDPEGSSLENRTGAIYYCRPDRSLVRVDTGLAYPNGIVITADRSAIIIAEPRTQQIHRYQRNADGTLGARNLFCQLERGLHGGPDGMCFDQHGNLYVAMFGFGCIQVIDPSGKAIGYLPTNGAKPTNCCFGPPCSPFETYLFVTETVTNAVWRYEVGVAGMPLHGLLVPQ